MKKHPVLVVFCAFALTIISFGSSFIFGAENPSKEAIVEGILKSIAEKQHSLGKYTVMVTATSKLEGAGQQIITHIQTQVTMDGFKKAAEKFVKADINGKPVTEEQYNQWIKKRQARKETDVLANLPESDWVTVAKDKITERCTLEGSETIDGITVYKLRTLPASENAARVKESYVYVEKDGYQIVKLTVVGNSNNGESQVIINYQKAFKSYFVPVLFQISGQGKAAKIQQEFTAEGEVKITDYKSL